MGRLCCVWVALAGLLVSAPVAADEAGYLRVRLHHQYHPQSIQVRGLDEDAPVTAIHASESAQVKYFDFKQGFTLTVSGADVERSYAGQLEVYQRDGELLLINRLSLEDYVTSVTLSEIGWQPAAAMRAQAVLARTWAISHRQPTHDYDFGDLTNGQHYRGLFPQTARASKVLQPTAGRVVRFRGKLANVYYYARCAERIYAAREVWGGEDIPYLSAAALPAPLSASKANDWVYEMPLQTLLTLFAPSAMSSESHEISVVQHNGVSGIAIDDQWFTMDHFRIRLNRKFGWNRLKSNSFEVSHDNHTVHFQGRGLGHLVGLCQQGAIALAQQGQSWVDIVQAFFPGTTISQYDIKVGEKGASH